MVLGRLAVDKGWEGRGIGRAMLRDAILRTLGAAEVAGMGAILVHAISERAKGFYLGCGFTPSDLEPMTLMITLAEAAAELSHAGTGTKSGDLRAIPARAPDRPPSPGDELPGEVAALTAAAPPPRRFVACLCVSTQGQSRSGLRLEALRKIRNQRSGGGMLLRLAGT